MSLRSPKSREPYLVMASMEKESLTFFPSDASNIDFTSSASSTSFATTFSARSNLSLPSFSSSSALHPLPHSHSDPHWSAVHAASNLSPDGALHLRHVRLLHHLGSGNLARVYHCSLCGFNAFEPSSSAADFALKVVDLDALTRPGGELTKDAGDGGKLSHVRTEARVLVELDHVLGCTRHGPRFTVPGMARAVPCLRHGLAQNGPRVVPDGKFFF